MSGKPRIWLFGDDVNTDLIIPGRYLDSYDPAHLASHAMEGANKDFAAGVSEGDIIVAGRGREGRPQEGHRGRPEVPTRLPPKPHDHEKVLSHNLRRLPEVVR